MLTIGVDANRLFSMMNSGHLDDLVVYERVHARLSFTAAARELGLSKASVSTRVVRLEERLGVRLLQRTTRSVRPTEAGRQYAERCRRILADVREADEAVTATAPEPHGLLRVTCPRLFGTLFLGPVLGEFLSAHPRVRVDVMLTERRVDLVEEGFDVGIRVGQLSPSSLVARRLGEAAAVRVAAPGGDTGPIGIGPRAGDQRACVDSLEMARDLAIAGIGAVELPRFVCAEALDSGALVSLGGAGAGFPIHAVYPARRLLSARVRRFVDRLVDHADHAPWAHSTST